MKLARRCIVLCLALALAVLGQQTQPPLLNTPVQYNPLNSYTSAAGSGTATVTISGVSGQRVRVYSVSVWCGGAPGSGIIPNFSIADAGTTIFAAPGGQNASNAVYPVGKYQWLPGLTGGSGNTVVITVNNGGACTQGTFVNVQADQF